MTCAICGETRRHHARGLCHTCYSRLRLRGELGNSMRRCSQAGCDRAHYGHGMCRPHYRKYAAQPPVHPNQPRMLPTAPLREIVLHRAEAFNAGLAGDIYRTANGFIAKALQMSGTTAGGVPIAGYGAGGASPIYGAPAAAQPGQSARDFAHEAMMPFFQQQGFTVGDHAADRHNEHQNGALDIMVDKCGKCHGEVSPTKGLDLVSPGVLTRLVEVRSTCQGRLLLEEGDDGAAVGFFIDKLDGPVAGCGIQMPFGVPPLTEAERACLDSWANQAVSRVKMGVTP